MDQTGASPQPQEFYQGSVAGSGTILAAGCETHRLVACLLEPIGGVYRLAAWRISPTPDQRPLPVQLHELCRKLGARLQRTLWDDARGGPLLQSPDPVRYPPLEQFVITASPRPRLRVWLVGLTEQNSLAAARRGLDASQTQLAGAASLTADLEAAALARELDDLRPEALVLTGGYENPDARAHSPMRRLAGLLAAALRRLPDHARPELVYAGNSFALPAVASILQESRLHSAENVLPAPGQMREQPLAAILDDLYDQKCRRVQGFARLAQWSTLPPPLLTVEDSFTRLVALWMALQGLRELYGLYAGGDRWLYVWADAGTNTLQTRYAAPHSAPSLPDQRPPLSLVSGPWSGPAPLPDSVRWHDPLGLAPIVAAAGQTSPAAAVQTLTHDLLLPPR
ncbi:MAG: glutamate mutase L [Chloroflexota bacterium]|nr:glutamate mutase L [Chloroflexota bacterium]